MEDLFLSLSSAPRLGFKQFRFGEVYIFYFENLGGFFLSLGGPFWRAGGFV